MKTPIAGNDGEFWLVVKSQPYVLEAEEEVQVIPASLAAGTHD